MSTSTEAFVVFARANSYDPTDFNDDQIAIAAFDSEADARTAYATYANPDRLVYKNAFLLSVIGSDNANDIDHRIFDDTFRASFPEYDVEWAELDEHDKQVDDGLVITVIDTNFRKPLPDEPLEDSNWESLDDDEDDENLRNILGGE